MEKIKDASVVFGENAGWLIPFVAPTICAPIIPVTNETNGPIVATAVVFDMGQDEGAARGHLYVCEPPEKVRATIDVGKRTGKSLVIWAVPMKELHPNGYKWLRGYIDVLGGESPTGRAEPACA